MRALNKTETAIPGKRRLLSSSFSIRCRLIGRIDEAKRRLDSNPCLRMFSYGTRLGYRLMERHNKESCPILELEGNLIRYTFFFDMPSKRTYSLNLLRCISILAYLRGVYLVDFGEVYPFFAEAMSESWIPEEIDLNLEKTAAESRILSSLNASNHVLAGMLIHSLLSLRAAGAKAYKNEALISDLFLGLEKSHGKSRERILLELGLETRFKDIFPNGVN
jgi:hypothetical protein